MPLDSKDIDALMRDIAIKNYSETVAEIAATIIHDGLNKIILSLSSRGIPKELTFQLLHSCLDLLRETT